MLTTPNAEVVCLIREKFSDQEIEAMGLWYIAAMHEPIKDPVGDLHLLRVDRSDVGCWLRTSYGYPDTGWYRESAFAFAAAQDSALSA